MNAKPSSEEIISALQDSGFLMEQEVATQLESLDFHVFTNRAFEDIEEGKSREIDVVARKRVAHNEERKLSAFIEIIVECKNTSSPFVFIGRPKNESDIQRPPHELVYPIRNYEGTEPIDTLPRTTRFKDPFFHLGFSQLHYDFIKDTKAVQFCRILRKGKKWHAEHGGLYDSIFYPMAKALTLSKQEQMNFNRSNEWRCFWFIFPVVAVSCDIFYVDSKEALPMPEPTGHVTFRRQIQSEALSGDFAIDFVRQEEIETYVAECVNPLAARATDLVMNQANFVLRKEIPWEQTKAH